MSGALRDRLAAPFRVILPTPLTPAPSLFRNLVVASTFASFTVAALSLGGARAPWTSYDSAVTGGGGSTQAYVIEIGVLRQRRCFEGACVTGDTTSFDSCDDVGKT